MWALFFLLKRLVDGGARVGAGLGFDLLIDRKLAIGICRAREPAVRGLKLIMYVILVRAEPRRSLKMRQRLLHFALLHHQFANLILGIGMIAILRNDLLKQLHRIILLRFLKVDKPKV